MTITHSHAKADYTHTTRTTYTLSDNTLTRILRAKVQTVQLKDSHTIADLYRLSNMDNDTFIVLAKLQAIRREKTT